MLVFMGKKCALYTGKYGNQTVNQSAARSVSKLPVGQSVSHLVRQSAAGWYT